MPAGEVLRWFPVRLVFEMGQKEGWGQNSECPSRGHLGSVDLGAGLSLGGVNCGGHSWRCCREIRKEWCVWGQLGGLEENSGRNQKKKSISI